ncbi:MAG: flagellar filament capping protein FliD [Syntrophobacter sp.]
MATSSTSSTSSGISVTGLGSGIDYDSIITKLKQVEEQKVTLLSNKITTYTSQLTAWQSFAGYLSSLQDASDALTADDAFNAYSTTLHSSSTSVDAEDVLSATATSSASTGSYDVVVKNTATAEKLGSNSYSSNTTALNVSGTILVNGNAVTVDATDTLKTLQTKINAVNSGDEPSGVTASILQESNNSYRLVLTSGDTGSGGISLQNGSSTDTLASLGFNGTGTVIKNSITGGAQSDGFSSSSTSVESLLGIASQDLSGTVTINGASVTLDLTKSLDGTDSILSDLKAAGISASIASKTEAVTTSTGDSLKTTYWLQIEGMSSWSDSNNVLQALGLVEGNRSDQTGVSSSVANTTDGSAPVTDATKITDMYGYLTRTDGDKITISGTTHDGTAVAATDLAITDTTTVGDLLNQVESLFGNVTASLTSDGKIQVVDNATGTSSLAVSLATTITGANAGTLDFGSFGTVGTVSKKVLQEGKDASFTVDGVSMSSATNKVTDAVTGVTLNLLKASPDTTITVDVATDNQTIEDNVNAMLKAYNQVISFVNEQMDYNTDSKKTGGVLFGDNVLKSIKNSLQEAMLAKVGSSTIKYMSDVGITIGSDNTLSLDSSIFKDALATSFNDVKNLFGNSVSSSDGTVQYAYSGSSTKSGTYTVNISQLYANGSSIAGTIDGKTGTGSGSILYLSDSSSGANGLGLTYSGSTAPSTVSVTFTRGLASVLASLTDMYTDSINGTVTTEESTLQNNIDKLNEKITSQEDLIDKKMTLLKTQFQNMDSAVTKLQSMQSYLSSYFG